MNSKNESSKDIIFYEGDDGLRLKVHIEDEDAWLTQEELASLYRVAKSTISYHIKNILEQGEQKTEQVVRIIRTTAPDGKMYNTGHYNLDMIISLGYRIDSEIAIKFRQWATTRLHEYIQKGFALDDERLKQNGGRYFVFMPSIIKPRPRSSIIALTVISR